MSDEEIRIKMVLDTTSIIPSLQLLNDRADEIAAKEVELRKNIARTARRAATLAISVIGFLGAIFSIAGFQLDALQQAVLLSIQQVISTAVAWFTLQAAIAAGSFGIQAVGLLAAAAALGVSIGNAAAIAVWGDRITNNLSDIQRALSSLRGIATTFVE